MQLQDEHICFVLAALMGPKQCSPSSRVFSWLQNSPPPPDVSQCVPSHRPVPQQHDGLVLRLEACLCRSSELSLDLLEKETDMAVRGEPDRCGLEALQEKQDHQQVRRRHLRGFAGATPAPQCSLPPWILARCTGEAPPTRHHPPPPCFPALPQHIVPQSVSCQIFSHQVQPTQLCVALDLLVKLQFRITQTHNKARRGHDPAGPLFMPHESLFC